MSKYSDLAQAASEAQDEALQTVMDFLETKEFDYLWGLLHELLELVNGQDAARGEATDPRFLAALGARWLICLGVEGLGFRPELGDGT